ncbi:hypothetical protein KAR91_16255 [Candidatus Pacearchaeota archaeon]|nr:hypothetical protein [Candidatus Pacearchaeota archaeon]
MNRFPCRQCLVRPTCSEYCDQLEENKRVISLYIDSNQCPDCGSKDRFFKSADANLVICKACVKAFERVTTVKDNIRTIPGPAHQTTLTSKKAGVITPTIPVHTYQPVAAKVTMEESHDLLYQRLPINMSRYVSELSSSEIGRALRRPRKPDKQDVGLPSWFDNYPKLFSDEKETSAGPIII